MKSHHRQSKHRGGEYEDDNRRPPRQFNRDRSFSNHKRRGKINGQFF